MGCKKSRENMQTAVIVALIFAWIIFWVYPLVGVIILLSACVLLYAAYKEKVFKCGINTTGLFVLGVMLTSLFTAFILSAASMAEIYSSSNKYIFIESSTRQYASFAGGKLHIITCYYYTVTPLLYEKSHSMYIGKYSITSGVVKVNGTVVNARWASNRILFSVTMKMSNVAFDGVTFTPVGHGNIWDIFYPGIIMIMCSWFLLSDCF